MLCEDYMRTTGSFFARRRVNWPIVTKPAQNTSNSVSRKYSTGTYLYSVQCSMHTTADYGLPNKVHEKLFRRHKILRAANFAGLTAAATSAVAAVLAVGAGGRGRGGKAGGGLAPMIFCSHCLGQLQGLPELGQVKGRFG